MLILVIWRANQDGNDSTLQLLRNVGERISKWTASIDRAFTFEADGVALAIGGLAAEVAHVGSIRLEALDDLTEDGVLALMINISFVSECLCSHAIDIDGCFIRAVNCFACLVDDGT